MEKSLMRGLWEVYGKFDAATSSTPAMILERSRDNLDQLSFGAILERHPEYLPGEADLKEKGDGAIEISVFGQERRLGEKLFLVMKLDCVHEDGLSDLWGRFRRRQIVDVEDGVTKTKAVVIGRVEAYK